MALSAPAKWMAAGALGLIALSSVPRAYPQDKARSPGSPAADAAAGQRSNSWPGFRGPGGIGHAVQADPPLTWNAKDGSNILWKTAIARHGMSSPVVSGNRLFLTAADDAVRQILCYNADTGNLLWQHDVTDIPGHPDQGLPNVLPETGFAAPTAVTDGRHVAAVFATGELVGVNMNGERVWARHLGLPKNHYGHASSLVSFEKLVIVQYDQQEDSRLLAFDLASGKPAWQTPRSAISWSSPLLVTNQGRAEVILTNSKGVAGYDPKSGAQLWQRECLHGEVAPSAAYAGGVVFVASEGAAAAAIDIGGHDAEPGILWHWDAALPDAASPLAGRDLVIIPTGYGVVNCLEAKTGKVWWEHEFSKGFSSSPILVNDRVFLIDMSGTMQIFKMAREFELVGTAEIGEGAYATPAFVGGRIYIRGLTHLFCIAERK
jgi:outer membrane protein assembly factor BamB